MDYAPDQPLRTPDVLMDVSNLVPDVSGNYVTAPVTFEFQTLTSTGSTDFVLAAATFRDLNETANYAFYGTGAKIYNDANTSVSATSYSVTANGSWSFCSFGDAILAANGVSKIQATTSMGSAAFTDITSAPQAKIVFEHQNAVVALNMSGNADGWACSDTGDYTVWTPAAGNFADSGDLFGGIGGPLTAGTTWDRLAVAFKANATYIGERVEEIDQAIHWEKLSDTIGCPAINGWIKTEMGLIFVSQSDILIYDGSKPRSIADARVRRAFNRRVPYYRNRIFLTHDDIEKNVYFWHNSQPQVDAYADSAFVFNYKSGKWGKVDTIQTNGTSYVQARCPLVGAVGTNFYAFGATGPGGSQTLQGNSAGSNHLIIHKSPGSLRACLAYRSTGSSGSAIVRDSTSGKPSFTTGYIGQHDVDSTLGRFWVVTESFDFGSGVTPTGSNVIPESATVTVIKEDLSTRTSGNAKVNATGMIDCVEQGRYFQVKPVWPTSIMRQTVSLMQPEFIRQTKGR